MPNGVGAGAFGVIPSGVALAGTALAVGIALAIQPPPPRLPDGSLLLDPGGGTRWIIDDGKRRFIRGPATFTACGYDEAGLIEVDALFLITIERGEDVIQPPCPFGQVAPPEPTPTPTPPPPEPPPLIPTSADLTVEQVCVINNQWEQLLFRFKGNPTIEVPVWTDTPTRPSQLTLWGQGTIVSCFGLSLEELLAQAGQRLIVVETADGCRPDGFGFMFVPNVCEVLPTPTPEPTPTPIPPPPEPSPWHNHAGACLHPNEVAARAAISAVFADTGVVDAMIAICRCESGFEPQCWNGGCCYGLFQINSIHQAGLVSAGLIATWPEMSDPLVNARAARWLFNQSGLGPWDCARVLGLT